MITAFWIIGGAALCVAMLPVSSRGLASLFADRFLSRQRILFGLLAVSILIKMLNGEASGWWTIFVVFAALMIFPKWLREQKAADADHPKGRERLARVEDGHPSEQLGGNGTVRQAQAEYSGSRQKLMNEIEREWARACRESKFVEAEHNRIMMVIGEPLDEPSNPDELAVYVYGKAKHCRLSDYHLEKLPDAKLGQFALFLRNTNARWYDGRSLPKWCGAGGALSGRAGGCVPQPDRRTHGWDET